MDSKAIRKCLALSLLLCLVAIPAFAVQKTIKRSYDFTKGLNTKYPNSMLMDSESPDMSNCDPYETGVLQTRKGIDKIAPISMSGDYPVQGLYRYYQKDGTEKDFAKCNTVFYGKGTAASATTWTECKTGLTAADEMYGLTFKNAFLWVDGSSIPQHSTGTATGQTRDLGTGTDPDDWRPNYAQYLAVFKNRLFFSGKISDANGGVEDSVQYNRLRYSSDYGYPGTIEGAQAWPADQYIDINTDDGDIITGLASTQDILYIFKRNSVHFLIGDDPETFTWIEGQSSVGCVAPRSIQVGDDGSVYFLHYTGVYRIQGARAELISDKITPTILGISDTYMDDAAGIYYSAKKQYWLGYCDGTQTYNNRVLVYDTKTGEWYPYDGLNISSGFCATGGNDQGELYIGDSVEGFIYQADTDKGYGSDPAQEKVIETLDTGWSTANGGANDTTNYKEGISSWKVSPADTATEYTTKSITNDIDLTSFNNLDASATSDYIHFWTYVTYSTNVASIDIYLDCNADDFSTDYYSYSISSASLTSTNNKWTEFDIAKSDFTRVGSTANKHWATITSIKFSAEADGRAIEVTFDDLRMIANRRTVIDNYRKTKYIEEGTPASYKIYKDLFLKCDISTDSDLKIDYLIDNAKIIGTKTINTASDVYLAVCDTTDDEIVQFYKNDYVYYAATGTAGSGNDNVQDPEGITSDGTYYYIADTENDRVMKRNVSDLDYVAKVGSNGSGNNQFDTPKGICVYDEYVYVGDTTNNRIVILDDDLAWQQTYGSSGTTDGKFDDPNGICIDADYLYVCDETNHRIQKFSYTGSTLTYHSKTGSFGLDETQFRNPAKIAVDAQYLYIVDGIYPSPTSCSLYKYNKNDLSFIKRVDLLAIISEGMNYSDGVAVDDNFVYISMYSNTAGTADMGIYKFSKNLEYLEHFENADTTDTTKEFDQPHGICINDSSYTTPAMTISRTELYQEGYNIQLKFYCGNETTDVGHKMRIEGYEMLIDIEDLQ